MCIVEGRLKSTSCIRKQRKALTLTILTLQRARVNLAEVDKANVNSDVQLPSRPRFEARLGGLAIQIEHWH